MLNIKKYSLKDIKIYFMSMAFTSLVLLLFCGMAVAETNTRSVAFGEKPVFLSLSQDKIQHRVKVKVLDKNIELDFSRIYRIASLFE